VVIGDSNLIIRGLRRLIKNDHPTLIRILLRIRGLEQKFDMVKYYHVYRAHNNLVDSLAKATKQLEQRTLINNEEHKYEPIP
jgi:hypothetical protein